MDDDSQTIAVGLGACFGGFAGLVIILCILWHCFCGSCFEKKSVQSAVTPIGIKDLRKTKHESLHKNHVTTVTSMNTKHTSFDLQSR